MDILRNLFGNVTSGIIRLAVTGGILFCAYLFIVKPVLSTTDHAIDSFNASGLNEIGKTLNTVNVQVQRQIRRSFKVTKARGGNPQRLIKCIKRANQDIAKIERCTRRF